MLLKYLKKNNIGLKNGINYKNNVLLYLFKTNHSNMEDWLNLLCNICNECEVNIKKEYIDATLNYIKKEKEENNNDNFNNIDYESIILNKFNQIE